MLITKKMLLAVTLVAAIVGGGLGSLITHSATKTEAANDNYQTTPAANAAPTTANDQEEAANAAKFGTSAEQTAYKEGFEQGYNSCASAVNNGALRNSVASTTSTYRAPVRHYSSTSTRRAYYDYNTAPRGRSFWSKHRDKLTMAIGTGAGAALGGLIGGKKGAGIGALAGLGGSALYTYKLRKRTPRY
ncbi:MAG TPA: hypothetical protein VN696_03010 [Pyrinomonadaceae bacterium]|nr:hypothetical protein [Pyrinomonadaceae bacterium]